MFTVSICAKYSQASRKTTDRQTNMWCYLNLSLLNSDFTNEFTFFKTTKRIFTDCRTYYLEQVNRHPGIRSMFLYLNVRNKINITRKNCLILNMSRFAFLYIRAVKLRSYNEISYHYTKSSFFEGFQWVFSSASQYTSIYM